MEKHEIYWTIRHLEKPEEMEQVEALQRVIWPDREADLVPAHLLLAIIQNGGLVFGAYLQHGKPPAEEGVLGSEIPLITDPLIGFVFGFPGFYGTPDGPRPKHCSHLLAVHPQYQDQGVGFALKRAQWQMVRHQGLDRITWTFDPLSSKNAYLAITRLGAVSSVYLRDAYGSRSEDLSQVLPSDRLQIDWWVNSKRVERRLSRMPRLQLDLAHFLSAGARILNPSVPRPEMLPHPAPVEDLDQILSRVTGDDERVLLLEIPPDFEALKAADGALAQAWREHTRDLFEALFSRGYLVTDFIHLPGQMSRSFYAVSHGESTL